MAPGRPFAIFSMMLEPLAECFDDLINHKAAVRLNLSESWFRKHQVLPSRTHPIMSPVETGGYLLCGTTIEITHVLSPYRPPATVVAAKAAAGAASAEAAAETAAVAEAATSDASPAAKRARPDDTSATEDAGK